MVDVEMSGDLAQQDAVVGAVQPPASRRPGPQEVPSAQSEREVCERVPGDRRHGLATGAAGTGPR